MQPCNQFLFCPTVVLGPEYDIWLYCYVFIYVYLEQFRVLSVLWPFHFRFILHLKNLSSSRPTLFYSWLRRELLLEPSYPWLHEDVHPLSKTRNPFTLLFIHFSFHKRLQSWRRNISSHSCISRTRSDSSIFFLRRGFHFAWVWLFAFEFLYLFYLSYRIIHSWAFHFSWFIHVIRLLSWQEYFQMLLMILLLILKEMLLQQLPNARQPRVEEPITSWWPGCLQLLLSLVSPFIFHW